MKYCPSTSLYLIHLFPVLSHRYLIWGSLRQLWVPCPGLLLFSLYISDDGFGEAENTTKLKPSPWIWWTPIQTQRNSLRFLDQANEQSHKMRCKRLRHKGLQWVWLLYALFPSAKFSVEFFRILVSKLRGPRLVSQKSGLGCCLLPVGPQAQMRLLMRNQNTTKYID